MKIILGLCAADHGAKKAVLSHLAPLLSDKVRETSLVCLDEPPAGMHVASFQEEAIARADVALVVLSADFFSDPRLATVRELLRQRRQESSLRIIPIVWQACLWEAADWLHGLVCVPPDRSPLAAVDRPRREQALLAMAHQLAGDQRSQLRKKLDRVIQSPIELSRFCADYLPDGVAAVHGAADLPRMIDLLLGQVEPGRVERALTVAFPDRTAQPGALQGAVLCATLRLDRKSQWRKMLAVCEQPANAVLILHGQREHAGLQFFVDRLQQFLATEMRDHHRVFLVPFLYQEKGAESADGWSLRLQTELSERLGASGPIDKLLTRASDRQPFFIILGRQPLGDLTKPQLDGLKRFLTEALPVYLRDKQHVRILIPYDYPSAKKSALPELEAAARHGAAHGSYLFDPLDEASLPPWSDAAEYLLDVGASATRIAALEGAYTKLRAGKNASYFDLATYLNRKLNA